MSPEVRSAARRGAVSIIALLASLAGCSHEPAQAGPTSRPAAASAGPAGGYEQEVVALLRAGWPREAVQRCRAALAEDARAPMPHALMALATELQPNQAARSCWAAVQRRAQGGAFEREVVAALQDYFGVFEQPELVDPRFTEAPSAERAGSLVRRLEALVEAAASEGRAIDRARGASLLGWAKDRAAPRPLARPPQDVDLSALLGHYNAYLAVTRSMPFEVSGYRRVVEALLDQRGDTPPGRDARGAKGAVLARIPRHPEHRADGFAQRLPGLQAQAGERWEPHVAAGFELVDGLGATRQVTPGDGAAKLVVFFLGFGCAHCVAQLKDLDPKAAAFTAAGIEVISIGTDSYEEVRAAQQASLENGVDPLHFDVLCDPNGEVFKQWQVWDEIEDEALHGTFLVDGAGRVLWRDISERPFEESAWLLEECQRLLAAWK
jgi:peroxiredoxin